MSIERFVVDARLLRELGERLVGQPHIALAELIKNSYDADARVVDVYFNDDNIRIVDDGHGMSHADFSERWLTIGTTIKERDRQSPELRRPFTGSKGVGRLSVQLLASKLALRTVGLRNVGLVGRRLRMKAAGQELHEEVVAWIDWEKAIRAGHIEDVEVEVADRPPSAQFASGSPCGTELTLSGLTHKWDANAFRQLARELWPLQPPFAEKDSAENSFQIVLHSPHQDVVREFNMQMQAILTIWSAKVTGRLLPRNASAASVPVYDLINHSSANGWSGDARSTGAPTRLLQVIVDIRNEGKRDVTFRVSDCHIDRLFYETRIFSLQHRQPKGVKVDVARQYLLAYGGVHIYDANFHLPYYGPDTDWLKIEQDHARRLSASRLLPSELQVSRGMLDLVPNNRLYGAVQVSTTHEAEVADATEDRLTDVLTVQLTRDRLVDNTAFDDLRRLVRAGMDLYAMETARQKFTKAKKRRASVTKPPSTTLRRAEESLGSIRDSIPEPELEQFDLLTEDVAEAIADAEAIERAAQSQTSLLGALATVGMTAMAYEHEISKQVATVERLARQIRRLATEAPDSLRQVMMKIGDELQSLAERTRRIKAIFAPLSDEETRSNEDAGRVRALVEDLSRSLEVVARGTTIIYDDVPTDMRFPTGGYAAWWSVLQNILLNALNATLDSSSKRVSVDAAGNSAAGWIRVQDTGVGLALDEAERMFEPFERGRPISRERAALSLGGSGLGLTIVRLITDELGIRAQFEPPEPGFNTAIRIFWKRDK